MADQPFLPLFVGDFLSATALWEGEERALYMLMLAYQWSAGALPSDLEKLSRALGYPHQKFLTLWETVSGKFEVQGKTLSNERLEWHRARTVEISAARSTAGSIGGKASAAKRAAEANAKKVPTPAAPKQATIQATVQPIVEPNAQANGQQKASILSDPILSNPIHSEHVQIPEGDGGNDGQPFEPPADDPGSAAAIAQLTEAEKMLAFDRVMAAMPKTTNRVERVTAERLCLTRIERDGQTWESLEAKARGFAEYCDSGGVSGPRYVMAAQTFFADDDREGPWRSTYEPLKSKAELAREEAAKREADEFERLKAGRAARGLADFRDPYPHESAPVYETALRLAERDRIPGSQRDMGAIGDLVNAKRLKA